MGQFDKLKENEEIIGANAESAMRSVSEESVKSVDVPNAEEIQAKKVARAENKIADGERIDEIRNELIGKNENNEVITNKYREYLKTNNLKISGLTLSAFLSENPDFSSGLSTEKIIDLRESIKDGILSDFENQQAEEEKSKKDFLNGLQEARDKDIVKAETERIFLDDLQESRRKDIEGSN